MEFSQTSIDVFISHSHEDNEIAKHLTALIRSAFNIQAERIRCTTVDGYRLPVGATTNAKLREELLHAKAFVALLTPASLESAYVLFELGARWGAGKSLAPILAGGATTEDLKEPLSSLNALTCDEPLQIYQLIGDMGQILGRVPGNPSSYQEQLDELVNASSDRNILEIKFYLSVEKLALKNLWPRLKNFFLREGVELTINLDVVERVCNFKRGTGKKHLTMAARKCNYQIISMNSELVTLILKDDLNLRSD